MELLSGTTLRHWMASPHPASEVLDVFCRAGDGLAAAHAGGIVHRDFKPENVMLDEEGEPKLVDFGLAILDSPAPGQLDSRNPEQRAIVGTLAYMAPEALRGRADARSDQFAFAAALWEALCGEFPYPIDDLDPSKRVVTSPPRAAKGLPPALFECLLRALHPDPARRFPKMSEVVARLRELSGELRSAASIAGAPAPLAGVNLSSDALQAAATTRAAALPGRSRRWLALPVVGAAVAVGALAALRPWAPAEPAALPDEPRVESDPVDAPPVSAPPRPVSAPGADAPPAAKLVPFSCPVGPLKGVWLFKDHHHLYSLELGGKPSQRCKFAATLKTESDAKAHGELRVEEFPPLLGVALGKFDLDGSSYSFFFTFEEDKLRGYVEIKGEGKRSSLILGGRRDADRKALVSGDQPCAALCVRCKGLQAIERCRAQCAGARDAAPGCPSPRDP